MKTTIKNQNINFFKKFILLNEIDRIIFQLNWHQLDLGINSVYWLRQQIDKTVTQRIYIKNELNEIGQLINNIIGENGKYENVKFNKFWLKGELFEIKMQFNMLETRIQKKVYGENQELGETLVLTQHYLNQADSDFNSGSYAKAQAEILIYRILEAEIEGLIR